MAETQQLSLVVYAKRRLDDVRPQLINLSEGALVVRAETLFEPNSPVDVSLHFVEANQEIQIWAEVVWANQRLGDMALRFVDISPGGAELIEEFLASREWK